MKYVQSPCVRALTAYIAYNVDIGCFGFFCLGVRHLEPQPIGLPQRVFKKTHCRHTFYSIKFCINRLLRFGIAQLSWVSRQLKAGFCRKIRLKSDRDRVGNRKSQNGIQKPKSGPKLPENPTFWGPLTRLDAWILSALGNRTFETPLILSATDCFGRPFPKNRNPSIR